MEVVRLLPCMGNYFLFKSNTILSGRVLGWRRQLKLPFGCICMRDLVIFLCFWLAQSSANLLLDSASRNWRNLCWKVGKFPAWSCINFTELWAMKIRLEFLRRRLKEFEKWSTAPTLHKHPSLLATLVLWLIAGMWNRRHSIPKQIWTLWWLCLFLRCRLFRGREGLVVLKMGNAWDFTPRNFMKVLINLCRNERLQSAINYESFSIERDADIKINENSRCHQFWVHVDSWQASYF